MMAQDLNEFIELDPGLRQIHTSSSMMAAGGTGVSSTVIEMQPMGISGGYPQHAAKLQQQSSASLSPSKSSSPARSSHAQQRSGSRTTSRPTDLASFDSSDTWASCQPFPSITDLAAGSGAGGCWSPSSSQPGASSSFHPAEIPGNQQLYVKPVANNNGSRGNENDDDEDNNENSQLLGEQQQQTEVQSNQNPVRSSKVFYPFIYLFFVILKTGKGFYYD